MVEKKEKLTINDLKKKIEELEKKKEEYLAGWQRARADFLNYKKAEVERKKDFLEYAREDFVLKILAILDNFERAARQNFLPENLGGQEKEKINQVIQGFLQIKKQLKDFLKEEGIEEIKCLGEKFNPKFHEAVEQIETKETESGIIIDVIKKGYKINDKVLRPVKVRVSK